jgi:hypothetical protein
VVSACEVIIKFLHFIEVFKSLKGVSMKKLRTLAALISIAMFFSSLVSATTPLNDTVVAEEAPTLLATDLPETININDARDRGHIERLKSEESDMYSAIFRNNNGTQSMYMFASPIKYKTPEGEIRDKSTKLTKTSTGYTMSDNDVNVSFETTANMSANLSYNDNLITIIPVTESKANGILKENALIYNNALGENTTLCYKPLLSGMNQEIILHSPESDSTYSFKLNTRKLIAKQNCNGVIDINNAEDTTIFKFSTYIVQDANGRTLENNLKIKANNPQSYTITIDLNDSILNEADIAYPLSVSLGITLNTSSAIEDTVIYSNRPTRNYGTRRYHNIGYLDDTYGIGRMLVKFPGLETNTTYLNLEPRQIKGASFCMYTASGYDDSVNHRTRIYRLENSPWNESTVTWNSFSSTVPNTDDLLEYGDEIYTPRTGGSLVTHKMTAAMRCWSDLPTQRQQGMLLRATAENSSGAVVDFCSTEYADSHNGAYMPYLVLFYDASDISYIPIHINILYDNAFAGMLYNYEAHISNQIQSLMAPVIDLYKERFGIQVNYSIHPYSSYPETENCANKNNRTELCNCFTLCEEELSDGTIRYHHKNQDAILSNLPNGNASTHFNMLFTGHKTCDNYVEINHETSEVTEYETCNGSGAGAVANSLNHRMAIFYTDDINNNTENIVISIAHEIGHMYGIWDHYNEHKNTHAYRQHIDDNCIWGDNVYDEIVLDELLICEYCTFVLHHNYSKFIHD